MLDDTTAPLLEVRDLRAWYAESQALQGVTFDVRPGELITLIGRNGAGKTTTLRSIMGIVKNRKGSIRFEGNELIGRRTFQIARLGLAYCPEERGIFSSLSVRSRPFPTCVPGPGRGAPACRAASSRCWPSPASCATAAASSCSTNPARASPR